jgi:cold shock CspA family protein
LRYAEIGNAVAVNGHVRFYDEDTAWGVIQGDDGGLYGVRGSGLPGPPLQVGEEVRFEPQSAPGGPRAALVRRLRMPDPPRKGKN